MESVRKRPSVSSRTAVAILSHDLSLNCTARSLLLGDLLRRRYPVEIFGPRFGRAVWEPGADGVSPENIVVGCRFPGFRKAMARLRERTAGAILYAQKPRFGSFGVALDAALHRAALGGPALPLLLDIDDEESFLFGEDRSTPMRHLISLWNPNGRAWTRRLAGRIREADAITAGSPSLARKYGGTFIPYAVDSAAMDPARFDPVAERRRLGIEASFVVVFCGSPKSHKGLDVLAEAIGLAGVDAHLHVIATALSEGERDELQTMARGRVSFQGPVPRTELARHLAAASAVVIPQRDTPIARMQVPAKLFDAMASGRAIVASRVGDLPEVLSDCGVLVEPADVGELVRAIEGLAKNPGLATDLGARARRRHQECFDAEEVSVRLAEVVDSACSRVRAAEGRSR